MSGDGLTVAAGTPQPRFMPNEAQWLLATIAHRRADWERSFNAAESHHQIVRRDKAIEQIARLDGIAEKIKALTDA